jgi:hypothetical protein
MAIDFCDPGGIQTPDFQNRNLTFYSAELRGRYCGKFKKNLMIFLNRHNKIVNIKLRGFKNIL